MNVDKMTEQFKSALVEAQSIALGYESATIEPYHMLQALLNQREGTTIPLLVQAGVDMAKCQQKLTKSLADLPKVTNSGDINLSREMQRLMNRSDQLAQKRGDQFIASHTFLHASLQQSNSLGDLLQSCGVTPDGFSKALDKMLAGESVKSADETPSDQLLDKYTIDLTQAALSGKLDPVIGRDTEIRRSIQVLQRRTKNNPVLIGAPGVGKTAIAEGLAQRIVNGEVPEALKHKRLLSLDLASLLAGAKYRGEFEERMKSVLKEIKKQGGRIVLFIDELHILVGAGRTDGAMDASNMLKPALARGELHCIGATTLDEYRQYIEKDAALERRFQRVLVDEPNEADTIAILRGLKERYELHHGVTITDPAIVAATNLSQRYITGRQLPDKAIDLIDEAASKIRMEIDSKPEALDKLDRRLIQLKIEQQALSKETDDVSKQRLDVLESEIEVLTKEYADIEEIWLAEKASLTGVQQVKEQLDEARLDFERAQRSGDLAKMSELQYAVIPDLEKQLAQASQRTGQEKKAQFLQNRVTDDEIASVVAKWTGIPVESMLASEREKILQLPDVLSQRVIGQSKAVDLVAEAIMRSRSGLSDPKRPIGSFLFLGPTGVGKTELCKALAYALFSDEDAMVRVDMSEFMEKHSVARLIGAPPGYVGYEQGGYLTELVRRKPYSVILLDEVEKAHSDVFNILLQVMDDGRLTDGQGRTVDFRHAIVVMTSNLGSQKIHDRQDQSESALTESVMAEVRQFFRPEFINRIDDCVVFTALDKDHLNQILDLQLAELEALLAKQQLHLCLTSVCRDAVLSEGYDPTYGARPLKRAIKTLLENPLAKMILAGTLKKDATITLDWKDGQVVAG
ncbi:MAG TPA: ATP-dependent chaperone ClpB [Proteobacteria bacterium]|nr:ATP-dependent chaperone ClpB [Pseudomonadota bacterium]